MNEEAVTFGSGRSLIGVVTDPPAETTNPLRHGVVLLNPGLVHRVGPGRIYVKIARALAARGFVVLRFDFSGIGDSGVRHDRLPFEKSAVDETREAIDFLRRARGIEHVSLLGGCSGAVISLRTADCDPRVGQAVLINFPVDEDEDEEPDARRERVKRSKAHYYWNFALLRPASWRKLATGKADYREIIRVLGSQARRLLSLAGKSQANHTQFATMLARLAGRGVSLTFVCSAGDPALGTLLEAGGNRLKQLRRQGSVAVDIIPRSDHTFSSLADQGKLLDAVVRHVEAITPEDKKSVISCAVSQEQGAAVPAAHTH